LLAQNSEEVMSDGVFSNPVKLYFKATGSRMIASTWEAKEVLRENWPEWARGRTYRSAQRACRDVLDGLRSPHEARRAFVAAARRAGILAQTT
jgi:hypothetical protein